MTAATLCDRTRRLHQTRTRGRSQQPEPVSRSQQPEPVRRSQQPEPVRRSQQPEPVRRSNSSSFGRSHSSSSGDPNSSSSGDPNNPNSSSSGDPNNPNSSSSGDPNNPNSSSSGRSRLVELGTPTIPNSSSSGDPIVGRSELVELIRRSELVELVWRRLVVRRSPPHSDRLGGAKQVGGGTMDFLATPRIDGPISEWSSSVRVSGCQPGAQVIVRSLTRPGVQDVATGTASGGSDRVEMLAGVRLKANDRLVAHQSNGGIESQWPPNDLSAVIVAGAPTNSVGLASLRLLVPPLGMRESPGGRWRSPGSCRDGLIGRADHRDRHR